MRISIRVYQPPDLPVLRQLTVDAFESVSIDRNIQEQFGVIGGRDWQWRKARHIEQDVARDPRGTFVAVEGDQIVGFISTWIDADAAMGNIPNLAVRADLRGQGLGRRLIQHALEHFRHQGVRHARIETLEQNSVGQQLYPSCGFREVARQIHYCMELDPPDGPN
jgi:ribosomal protein S18 acetylase RimI-like enzyme